MKELLILTLLNIKGFGNSKVKYLFENSENYDYNKSDDILDLIKHNSKNKKVVPTKDEIEISLERAQRIVDKCDINNIKLIQPQSKYYPKNLKDIGGMPMILYSYGNTNLLKNSSNLISIIGTRKPSVEAVKLGKNLTNKFLEKDFVVVSGLALGCDSIAHSVCVEKNKPTIAVLPSGFEKITPLVNKVLSQDIIEQEGLLLSEYEPSLPATKNKYIERNRIITGISRGTCVIQCSIKGGTMESVKLAQKQKRPIGVLDFSFSKIKDIYQGNNYLINNINSFPLGSVDDVQNYIETLSNENKSRDTHQGKLFET